MTLLQWILCAVAYLCIGLLFSTFCVLVGWFERDDDGLIFAGVLVWWGFPLIAVFFVIAFLLMSSAGRLFEWLVGRIVQTMEWIVRWFKEGIR